MYMAVCACDFMLFPVLWSMLQAIMHTTSMAQWQPLTLQGAGLFHIAMGAVLGIAAMGRTQEKLAGANNGGAATTSPGGFTAPSIPTPSFAPPTPVASASVPTSFSGGQVGSPPPAPVGMSKTGLKAPVPPEMPEI